MNVIEKPMANRASQSNDDERVETHSMRILDATEAASLIRMDSRTLIRWARLGYVPAHPLGEGKRRLWRFIEAELLEWFQQRSITQRRPPARSIETAIGAHARRTA
jgi:predicted DNA-binding transcriptional regulator AlpA